MSPLHTIYKTDIAPKLMKELGIANTMAVPKLKKIVINCGVGAEAQKDKKVIEKVQEQLGMITGQRPQVTRAKQAIAAFKLRAGDPVGLRVTLRGTRMYDFITKLTIVALPRVRDFRGIPNKGFDGRGNYNFSIKEQIIFPEIDVDKVDRYHGMNITVTTTAKTNEEARLLLETLGFPFRKD